MTAAFVPRLALASLVLIAAGCEIANHPQHQAQHQTSAVMARSEQPVALATLELPVVAGSRGRIAGVIRGWPFATEEPAVDTRDPLFTYVIDFRVVETKYVERRLAHSPERAEGVRLIYFHPEGARTAFSDLSTFVEGDPIAADRVRFSFDFMPDFGQVALRMLVRQMWARSFDYEGRTITPPAEREESFAMFGRFSPGYGGFLLTSDGA
jgi:hypothetical protein